MYIAAAGRVRAQKAGNSAVNIKFLWGSEKNRPIVNFKIGPIFFIHGQRTGEGTFFLSGDRAGILAAYDVDPAAPRPMPDPECMFDEQL